LKFLTKWQKSVLNRCDAFFFPTLTEFVCAAFRVQEAVDKVQPVVEERLISSLLASDDDSQKESFLKLLREGALEDRIIEVEVPMKKPSDGSGGLGAVVVDIASILESVGDRSGKNKRRGRTELKKMKIRDARPIIEEEEKDKMIDEGEVIRQAIASVEQNGIVFIDEIDKVVSHGDRSHADASAEGVQRDLLPLIEGTSVSCGKFGNVNTDFILFIASGAFHSAKPSDLLAELQGRLPIRVTLTALTEDDFYRILTEPKTNLLNQQVELMKAEEVELSFHKDAIREIAHVAFVVRHLEHNSFHVLFVFVISSFRRIKLLKISEQEDCIPLLKE
jgi:ATP-dependent HslUV protease ATP-binding subunit HslU